MSSRADQVPPAIVLAVVLAGDGSGASETVAAIGRQAYETSGVVLVGGDEGAAPGDVSRESSFAAALDGVEPDVTHLWILRAGARPRPDALGALIADSARSGADLAGSKILDGDNQELLRSVGLATDAFGVPYRGLDDGEVDAGQYDVVRDVAAVDGTSMLVRRDLLKGLGGLDPLLAPEAAAIDLSQRARLRSVRVVVVPSSEVPYEPSKPTPGWFEEAGQIRAMIKSYGPLTLLWALPVGFLIGLLEALVAPFVGRWTLFTWARAWLWNLAVFPSTLVRRFRARRGGVVGDEELYRYQLRGSAKLRRLREDIGDRVLQRLGGEEGTNLAELAAELRAPSFLAGLFGAVFVALATRSLWSGGFPASGFSLPLPASGPDAVAAYAGGWNPGGFGSSEQLPPFIGFAGALQTILFDNPGLTTAVLVVAAFAFGVWGTTRLLRTWDVGPAAGVIAGITLMAGPATQSIADATGVTALLALGALPWTLRIPLSRAPQGWLEWVGRVAGAALAAAFVGLLSPLFMLIAPGALLVWAIFNVNRTGSWRAAGVSVAGTLVALPVLLPWLDAVYLPTYLNAGVAFWTPGDVAAAVFVVAFSATMVAVSPRMALLTGWGGVMIAAGTVIARTGDAGPGREVEYLGVGIVALGSAVVIGIAVEGVRRVVEITGWRRVVVGVGAVTAVAFAASAILVLIPGRAGLPPGELEDRIGFTAAAAGTPSDSRILLIGPPETLPGESREVREAGYRVVSAPIPEMWEAWLPSPNPVDVVFQSDLETLIDGEAFRGGEMLARYGIRWVISMGDTPLEEVFAAQLDLLPLPVPEGSAFVVDADLPVRAVTDGGVPWSWTPSGYEGEPDPDARVTLAETYHPNWGPDGERVEWAPTVSAGDGAASFEPRSRRRSQAVFAAGFFGLLLIGSFVGRRRR